jgi:3',5'-cyclic AMP phosphodiesterase CpdA
MTAIDLAHITDVHLGPLPQARLAELMSKRAFGYMSWHRRRHRLHRLDALQALAQDLGTDPPDHIAVTGDLVNIALPEEFEQAARWLAATAEPDGLTLVPGNHDAYAGRTYRTGWSRWQPYMSGDDTATAGTFPFVRRVHEQVALIGLSSAVPSAVGFATGLLGPAQLEALDQQLAELGGQGFCRILLLHHPPLGPMIRRRRGLRDETALRAVIERRGAELILSGHEHVFLFGGMPGAAAPVPVVVGPSASLAQGHPETGGYLRFVIDLDGKVPRITLQLRRFDPEGGGLAVERTARIERRGQGLHLAPAAWPKEPPASPEARATGETA